MKKIDAPYIKFGAYKSKDENKPDILELQVVDTEPFETQFSVNAKVNLLVDNKWVERILPLKNHDSKNDSLLREWEKNAKRGIIWKRRFFKVKTWLGTSRNERTIRRFKIIFY